MDMLITVGFFILYFAGSIGIVFGAMAVYMLITPHDEVKLMKEGNASAAIAYTGTLIGLALPVASVVANSVSFVDFLIWGVIAAVVQVATFFAFRLFYPRISERIEKNEIGVPLKLAAVSVSVGILNAASMTY